MLVGGANKVSIVGAIGLKSVYDWFTRTSCFEVVANDQDIK